MNEFSRWKAHLDEVGYQGCECCRRRDHIYDDFENGPTGAEHMSDDFNPNDEFERDLLRQAEALKAENAGRVCRLEQEARENRKSRNAMLYALGICTAVALLVGLGALPWGFIIPLPALVAYALLTRTATVRQQRQDRQRRFENGELV